MARKVARNALYNSSALVVGNISGLSLTIILARILKPENFGIYSLVLSVAMLAIAFSNLGIDGAVIRYTAYYIGKNDLKKVRGHLYYFFKIKFFLALIIAAILITSAKELASVFRDERLAIPFMIAGGIVFFASLANFFKSFFIGLQEFRYYFLKQSIYELFRWVFGLPLAFVFLASGALAGYSIAHLIAFLFLSFIVFSRYEKLIRGERSEPDRSSRKFIGFMTIASVSGITYTYIDSVMIGYLLNSTEVGFYRASYTIIFAIVGLISSLSMVLFPTFTQMSNRDIMLALKRLNKYVSIIAFPAAAGLFFLSEELIRIVYGIDYLNAIPAMIVLSFALIPGAFNYLGTIFNSKERPDVSAAVITVSMILNVMLNYFFILSMGIVGAALATVISRFFLVIAIVLLLWKTFGIKTDFFVTVKPIFSSLVMLGFLVLLPKPESLAIGIIEVISAILLYFGLLFLTKGLTREDLRYFKDIIKI